MTTVTVELADLEKLIFGAAAIKPIEAALAQRQRDPFVREHLDFAEAHDRLATAMRNATRATAGTAVKFDEPLTKSELRNLRYIHEATDPDKGSSKWFVISKSDRATGEYESLAAKGHIQIGQFVTGIVWAGAPAADIKADPERGFGAKMTARGRAVLATIDAGGTPLGAG